MTYLCENKLMLGGIVYYPGEKIPEQAILPGRVRKLIKSGYLSELKQESKPIIIDKLEKGSKKMQQRGKDSGANDKKL